MNKKINLNDLKEPQNKEVLKKKRAQKQIINTIKVSNTREILVSVRLNEEEAENMAIHAIEFGEGLGPFLRRILRDGGYFKKPTEQDLRLSEELRSFLRRILRDGDFF